MLFKLVSFSSILAAASAVTVGLGVSFEESSGLPLVKLPYGTWRASQYNNETDVYAFHNIRYAAPPVGDLRWEKPAPPEFTPGIQDGSYGHNCVPASIPDAFDSPIWENITKNAAEDCLFLDVYIPGKVLRNHHKRSVPVVVWIHGGAYVTGSKDMAIGLGFYDGTSLVQRADNDLIVVTINYRLGGFGFMAGKPLETDGVLNAGLHDQRAALRWVQSYIRLLGGDPTNVTVWGQSAGAGSILYHLLAKGGKQDPLFRRAMLQSPGFGTNADVGKQYKRFESFVAAAGCGGAKDSLRCLRHSNSSVLKKANEEIYSGDSSPIPDGKYIRQPALVEFAQGNYWKDFDSLIISHVLDESSLLLPNPVPPNYVEPYIAGLLYPNSTTQTKKLVDMYRSLYRTEKKMALAATRDITFTCNLRAAVEAYPQPSWSLQYSFLDGAANATHGSDSAAMWYNPKLQGYEVPQFAEYQQYITNHARSGDPNKPHAPQMHWPQVTGIGEEELGNVLNIVNDGFELLARDDKMLKSVCDAWTEAFVEGAPSKG